MLLLYLGKWGDARQNVADALAIAERNANVQAGALCRLTAGWLHAEVQDFESAARYGEAALNATVGANPFNFFIGRNSLVRAQASGWAICRWRVSISMRSSDEWKPTALRWSR